ncbi:hypothetical protein GXM_06235 [Nostoc sphaeroides CCNUC1]|uniref:Uncharacterized protein n=1 Tax=Nostoc sphaeroides CCNUC1 TaxID=2653204 RepID=A0A5P8W858_9NOSO|nr:hypothetical protein GXM_06235 [Nostoc sphaeroides CCNUC1]
MRHAPKERICIIIKVKWYYTKLDAVGAIHELPLPALFA